MAYQIGWAISTANFSILAGSSGAYQFTYVVTQSDGSALPTYDGWTCEINLYSQAGVLAIAKTPDVVGDSGAKTLTLDLSLVPGDTLNLAPGVYSGIAWLTDPTDGAKYGRPNIVLTVQAHNG